MEDLIKTKSSETKQEVHIFIAESQEIETFGIKVFDQTMIPQTPKIISDDSKWFAFDKGCRLQVLNGIDF